MRMNQYRRDLRRIQTALFKGFNNHLAGLILVLAVNLLNGHQSGTGDRAIEIVGVGGAPGGQIEPGLRPDRRMAGMGMHDPTDLRIAAIERQMGRGIGRRFFVAFNDLTAGDLYHHHIVGGHHLIFDAGRLNDHQLAHLIDRADVAPGKGDQPVRREGQVGRQHLGFQLL